MKRIAILGAVAIGLLAPASAQAKNIKHKGVIKGDDTAVVKLRVGLSGGEPAKIAGFRVLNARARCGRDRVRITLRVATPIKLARDNTFRARLTDDRGGELRLSGRVKAGGKRTRGKLSTNEFKSGKKTCRVPRQRWKTSR